MSSKTDKALAIIKASKNPVGSSIGYFATGITLTSLKKDIPSELQRQIYYTVYLDLKLLNLSFASLQPLLFAYSREMAQYITIVQESEKELVSKRRDDDVINQELVYANRCLDKAMQLAKLLSIDVKGRLNLEKAAIPQPKQKGKKKKDDFEDQI